MSAKPGKGPAKDTARLLAARVVEAVLTKGEFAARCLDQELANAAVLRAADRALATELTYGVLRTHGALKAKFSSLASRGIAGNDKRVLCHLLVAGYQIAFLQRVPAFAAVNEAVEAVSALRGKRVAGFCNAVLRRFAELPKLTLQDAMLQTTPAWLFEQLREAVGEHETLALLGASETATSGSSAAVSGSCIRLREGAQTPEWLSEAQPTELFERAFKHRLGGDVRRFDEYAQGDFVIQDEGSMFAAMALGAQPGERILDACAGRGHKSSLLAERLGSSGQLWVCDRSESKLRQLATEFQRLRLPSPVIAVTRWGSDAVNLPRDFDRVLVDAPCTGTGTLRRRPEIMQRLQPEDVERLATSAETILRQAADHARPGGRVLFVVCSALPRETQGIVARVSDALELVPFDYQHPLLQNGTTQLQLLPGRHGCDGFFLASFRRR